jgi:hypothetical protein
MKDSRGIGAGSLILSLVLFLLAPISADARTVEDRLSGVTFSPSEYGVVSVYNLQVPFVLKSQSGAHSFEYIEQIIYQTSRIVFEYLEDNGVQYRDIKPGVVLDFYEVELSILNDQSRFERSRYYPGADAVYGIWEPLSYDSSRMAIIVSSHQIDISNRELFSHEVGHFWYSRLGLVNSLNLTHEEFAEVIESLYLNKFRGGATE